MIEKEQVFVNEEADVAVVRYTDLIELLSKNMSLTQQVGDMKKVIDSWEELLVFTELFVDEGCNCNDPDMEGYIGVDELFDTVPYELMY